MTVLPTESPRPRERELLNGSATVQAADFHSTRRVYATSLARSGVNAQTAMALTGHSDHKVHQCYVEAVSIRALPAGAIRAGGESKGPGSIPTWPLKKAIPSHLASARCLV